MEKSEKLLSAEKKYLSATEKEFYSFCDDVLKTDTEIEVYCKEKNIPY